ncbi:acyltransferase family protein [Amnibacterium setariae]|uniref:acyltransferase family protein n=1 Tax=Amnibacterium setariae TaxID=2306585 RepID=UPI0022798F72|nr:acyltransferase family protein [Amnibacterium setariae]
MTLTAPAPTIEAGVVDGTPSLGNGSLPSPSPRQRHDSGGRRRDVQGLRAVAVIAVLGDHLFERPSGGYLGVDIFFVISGFLITGLLLREYSKTGRIDLPRFYKRRIKRTLPVAWVVLLFTLIAGSFVLSVYGFAQLWPAAVSAGAFWSNWQLIGVGADYLHATDAPSAVQHYWSLAVEEQFYLIWPALLLGALVLARRPRLRAVPVAVLTTIGVASLVWAAAETAAHPLSAYFSTLTRGWELLAGAGLAFAAPLLVRLPAVLRPWLAWCGFAMIIGGVVVATPDSPFPFPWALVPVLGTAVVIAAGAGGSDTQVWPLTNGLAQSIGAISYSIYLWHFPVAVFVQALHPAPGLLVHGVELLLVLLLSVLSYRLVEVPFRTGSWHRPRFPRPSRRSVIAVVGGIAASSLIVTALVETRSRPVAVSVSTAGYFDEQPTPAGATRGRLITEALRATSWPRLTPDDQQLGEGARVPEWTRDGCLNAFGPEATASRCVYGEPEARRTVIVYGDSVALSYVPGIRAALAGRGWRIKVLTSGQCPAVMVGVTQGDGSPYPQCDEYREWALQRMKRERPELVVMVSSYLSLDRLASGSRDLAAAAEWTSRTTSTVKRLEGVAHRLLVLDAPPIEASPQSCKTGLTTPQDCVTGVPENWKRAADAQHAGARLAGLPSASYPSTLPWFCSSEGVCPSFVADVVTLADGMHLTDAGSRQLAPLLREAVQRAVGDAA